MDIQVIVVEPIYQINLGYVARIAKNFSVKSLVLVNPKCKYKGKNAIKYAKHGIDILESAKICKSMDSALKGTFSIGTTAQWRKGKSSLFNIQTLEDAIEMLNKNKISKLSIVLGRESTGLTKDELRKCSMNVYIPLPGSYNVLNISHALAILLYEMTKLGQRRPMHIYANDSEICNTVKLFDRMISTRKDIRSKHTVSMAMAHMLKRSHPSKKELSAISVALSKK